jgi:hypothetical protein
MILPHGTCVSEIMLKNSFVKTPLLVFEILKPHFHPGIKNKSANKHEREEKESC